MYSYSVCIVKFFLVREAAPPSCECTLWCEFYTEALQKVFLSNADISPQTFWVHCH